MSDWTNQRLQNFQLAIKNLKTAGRYQDAIKESDSLIEFIECNFHEDPNSLTALKANSLNERGKLFDDIGEFSKAINNYTAAMALLKSLLQRGDIPPQREWCNNIAILYSNRGNSRYKQGSFQQALNDFDEAIRTWKTLIHHCLEEYPLAWLADLASVYSSRGVTRNTKGDSLEALKDFDEAIQIQIDLIVKVGRNCPPGWRLSLAQIYSNRGVLREEKGNLLGAKKDHNDAVEVGESLFVEFGDDLPMEWKNYLAAMYFNRGSLRWTSGDFPSAREDFEKSISILEPVVELLGINCPLAWRNDLAKVYSNKGLFINEVYSLVEAGNDYNYAISIWEGLVDKLGDACPAQWKTDLASTYSHRSVLRNQQADFAGASSDLDVAICIQRSIINIQGREGPPIWRESLARLYSNRGSLHSQQGSSVRAKEDYEVAIRVRKKLIDQLGTSCDPVVRNGLVGTYSNLGLLYSKQGDPREACEAYSEAIRIGHRLICQFDSTCPPGWRVQLTGAYSNRAVLRYHQGDPLGAQTDYGEAIRMSQYVVSQLGDTCPLGWRNDLARIYSNRGVLSYDQDDTQEARDDYERAIKLGEELVAKLGKDCPPSWMVNLATTYASRGVLCRGQDDFHGARDNYERALELWKRLEADLCKDWSPEWRSDLARLYTSRAVLLSKQSDTNRAALDLQAALDQQALVPTGVVVDFDTSRFATWNLGARLLSFRQDNAEAWARDVSGEMCRLLDTWAPIPGSPEFRVWQKAYGEFTHFHLHWLAYAIDQGETALIPEIVSLCQGREIASAAVEELLRLDRKLLPTEVAEYLQGRLSLRELRQRIAQVLGRMENGGVDFGGSIPDEPTGRRNIQTNINSGLLPEPVRLQLQQGLQTLQAEEKALRVHTAFLKARAATLDGYGDLTAAFHPVTLTEIQQRLRTDEVALLLIEVPEGGTEERYRAVAILIRSQGMPEVVALGALSTVSEAVSNFRLPGRGACRRDGTVLEDKPVASKDFWDDQQSALQDALWEPLQDHLTGVRQIAIITHGALHRLPLGHRHPSTGAALLRYPGLVFFQRLRQTAHQHTSTTTNVVGVLTHAGDNPTQAIPLVFSEVAMVRDLYQTSRCDHPANYPSEQPEPVYDLLHIACHGDLRSNEAGGPLLPVLHTGPEPLGRHEILVSRNHARHLYIGACLGGNIDEDLTGSPAGIISSVFQKGGLSASAALVSIPDEGAWLLACLFHYCLSKGNGPVGALHQAQDLLAEAAARRDQGLPSWEGDLQPWLTSQMDLLKATQKAHLYQFLHGLSEEGGRRLPPGWLKKHRESLIPWMGYVPDERIDELLQSAYRLGGYDEAAYGGFVDQVMASLPLLPAPPEEPALGALLYGFVAYGEG